MPRVCLTNAQREEAAQRKREQETQRAVERMQDLLVDKLAAKKNREGLNQTEIGTLFGVPRNTMSDLLHGENVRLPLNTAFRMLYELGLEVRVCDRT